MDMTNITLELTDTTFVSASGDRDRDGETVELYIEDSNSVFRILIPIDAAREIADSLKNALEFLDMSRVKGE